MENEPVTPQSSSPQNPPTSSVVLKTGVDCLHSYNAPGNGGESTNSQNIFPNFIRQIFNRISYMYQTHVRLIFTICDAVCSRVLIALGISMEFTQKIIPKIFELLYYVYIIYEFHYPKINSH